MAYRTKVVLYLLCSILILIGANVSYQAIDTLNRLDVIERDRDSWQHADEIIRELKLNDGNVVADVGCGSGYFSLKLSAVVGAQGTVIAVDIRKLSLAFLRTRAVLRGAHNISVVVGDEDDPRLPATVDAVLVVNTYHEFDRPAEVLKHVRSSLAPGGRLVIADRAPLEGVERERAHHEIAASEIERQLTDAGFEIVSRTEHFAEQPNEGWWWLLVAVAEGQPKYSTVR